jgi:hypothetical protein
MKICALMGSSELQRDGIGSAGAGCVRRRECGNPEFADSPRYLPSFARGMPQQSLQKGAQDRSSATIPGGVLTCSPAVEP